MNTDKDCSNKVIPKALQACISNAASKLSTDEDTLQQNTPGDQAH